MKILSHFSSLMPSFHGNIDVQDLKNKYIKEIAIIILIRRKNFCRYSQVVLNMKNQIFICKKTCSHEYKVSLVCHNKPHGPLFAEYQNGTVRMEKFGYEKLIPTIDSKTNIDSAQGIDDCEENSLLRSVFH